MLNSMYFRSQSSKSQIIRLFALGAIFSLLLFKTIPKTGPSKADLWLPEKENAPTPILGYLTSMISPLFNSEVIWSQVSEMVLQRLQLKIEDRLRKASLCRKRMSEEFSLTKFQENISNIGEIPPKFVAINEESGRLGNFIFRVASLLGIARNNKRIPVFLTDDQRKNLFFGMKIEFLNETDFLRMTKQKHLPKVIERGANIYASFIGNLSKIYKKSSVIVSGYLQSWKYFHKFKDEIRAVFTFTPEIWTNCTTVIQRGLRWLEEENKGKKYKIKSFSTPGNEKFDLPTLGNEAFNLPTLVGIHVRRTDVVLEPINLNYGYVAATNEYLVNTLQYVINKHKNRKTILFVVTDDVNYCRKTLKNFENLVFSVENSPEVDMAILSLMDTVIMTVGSFGWWGAYLSDATDVFYYKDWPLKNSVLRKFTHHRDYFLPNWQGRS